MCCSQMFSLIVHRIAGKIITHGQEAERNFAACGKRRIIAQSPSPKSLCYSFGEIYVGIALNRFFRPRMRRGNAFGLACLCVCLSCLGSNSNWNLKTSFPVCRHVFRTFKSSSCIKVIGWKSRSQEQNCVCDPCDLTFECVDLHTSFLVRIFVFRTLRSRSSTKVMRSRSWRVTKYTFAGGPLRVGSGAVIIGPTPFPGRKS